MIKIRSSHKISTQIVSQDPKYYLRNVKEQVIMKNISQLKPLLAGEFHLNRIKTSMSEDEMEIDVEFFLLKGYHVDLLKQMMGEQLYHNFIINCSKLDKIKEEEYNNSPLDRISKLEDGEEIKEAAESLNIKTQKKEE